MSGKAPFYVLLALAGLFMSMCVGLGLGRFATGGSTNYYVGRATSSDTLASAGLSNRARAAQTDGLSFDAAYEPAGGTTSGTELASDWR